jgi:uroporphyrinogen decarboxylase
MNSFLDALHCRNRARPPVWLMRQAGRYLPAYRALRSQETLWSLFHTPELAAKVTRMPLELGVDAAILFSDILVTAELLGKKVHFPEGSSPYVTPPVTSAEEVAALPLLQAEEVLSYVKESILELKRDLPLPLIGFCGAPFTIASYLIESGGKNELARTKEWLYRDPLSFHALLEKITKACIDHLQMQVRAGVDAVQIFDSWAGLLAAPEFEAFSLPYLQRIQQSVTVPVILFCRGSSLFAHKLAALKPACISFDWHLEMHTLRQSILPPLCVQGNLDPHLLLAPQEMIRKKTEKLLSSMRGDPGFIVNLGHGVLPTTPVENVRCLIDTVHAFTP